MLRRDPSGIPTTLRLATACAALAASVVSVGCEGSSSSLLASSATAPPIVPAPAVVPAAAPEVVPSEVVPPVVGDPSTITLRTGFMPDPRTARGQAGGAVEGTTLSPSNPLCRAWVPSTPQHTLALSTHFTNLRVIVSSRSDTTLLIRGPDGQLRCADDSEGLNPIVEGAFAPGIYQVYVGAYSQGGSTPYVIGFSELGHVTAARLGR